jgi:hypothetical protein
MHPVDCPAWEYQDVAGHSAVIQRAVATVVLGLRGGRTDGLGLSRDTRGAHGVIFESLTPAQHDYFAGHYRGERFRCLQFYGVQVASDPRVGCPPHQVSGRMSHLASQISEGISALDAARSLPRAQITDEDRLLFVVAFACRVFELFLRLHPYANGNGHLGRVLIWAILGRYGYWPVMWPIEPRPPDPPYTDLIVRHRNGDREPLEQFVLSCVG